MTPALIATLAQVGINLVGAYVQWKATLDEAKKAGQLTQEQVDKLVADVKGRAAVSDAAWDDLVSQAKSRIG